MKQKYPIYFLSLNSSRSICLYHSKEADLTECTQLKVGQGKCQVLVLTFLIFNLNS